MKIVLGVDGSKYARWATEWIARLPLTKSACIVALHALDIQSLKAPFVVQPVVAGNARLIQTEIKRLEAHAKAISEQTKDLLAASSPDGKVFVERGRAASLILKHARRGDLIVVGSRGLDAVDRFMLGSVSTLVAHHAPCSVLVVKQPPRPIKKILLAMDGSKSSEKAAQFLMHNLRPENREVLVAHVMPFMQYPELKDAGQGLVDRYAERLRKVGYRVDGMVKLGHPADELIKAADRNTVDFILAGAKGLGAIARFFLGSISTKLVQHSRCSVLIVR